MNFTPRDPRPHEIFNFFHPDNYTVKTLRSGASKNEPRSNLDFLNKFKYVDSQRLYFLLDSYVGRRLLKIRRTSNSVTWYESTIQVSVADQDYGSWDFEIEGFPAVREAFSKSVLSIVVETAGGAPDIGSAFMLSNNRVVTAKHCVEGMAEIKIGNWPNRKARLQNIYISSDPSLDLAVLQFDDLVFDTQEFQLDEAKTLDEVLAMGYPPIPGFQKVQVAETAKVAAVQKATVGEVVADDAVPYLGGNYSNLLVSARIKGGNSGGPIINKFGKVVGIAEMLPAGAEGRADQLGFAVAICASELRKLIAEIDAGKATPLPFKNKDGYIQTAGA